MSPDAEIRAVVLLSGGLDSATVLAEAAARGRSCYAMSVNYGQRHAAELQAARTIAERHGAKEHRVVSVDFNQFGGSALTDDAIAVPDSPSAGIPTTYVPARNTIMLALALGWAEILSAQEIHIGVNAIDYSGYPDCRPEFIQAFQHLAGLATRAVDGGEAVRICTPLLALSKAEIIRQGVRHGVDFAATVSCYQADDDGRACGRCDACRLRREGFEQAQISDPTRYQASALQPD
ncbi:MAG: 7-cyano-7-deazaguanine synthase QueC [Gammaproteobacteria bacterium]